MKINNAEHFFKLINSPDAADNALAVQGEADEFVWLSVIMSYPELLLNVVRNKNVPLDTLAILALHSNEVIRKEVAAKRKIDDKIFALLAKDVDENVRFALMNNLTFSIEKKKEIVLEDSIWLQEKWEEILKES
jgi:hypothetical protein